MPPEKDILEMRSINPQTAKSGEISMRIRRFLIAAFVGIAVLPQGVLAQEAGCPAKVDPGLAVASLFQQELPGLEKIGQLKAVPSSQISRSNISIGFECLDRFILDPAKCYDKLAETGTKWARCQTGWCRCETVKGVYDFK